jgi:hypothetical protein
MHVLDAGRGSSAWPKSFLNLDSAVEMIKMISSPYLPMILIK